MKLLSLILVLFGTNIFADQSTTTPAPPIWEYEAPVGPDQWGSQNGYQACSAGFEQSPIAIETGVIPGFTNITEDFSVHAPQISWGQSAVQLINNGHTVQVQYDPGSNLTFEGSTYELKQFHFHSVSEHIIDGHQYPLEIHFVHQSSDVPAKLLVVGVIVQVGSQNLNLQKIWDYMPLVAGTKFLDPNVIIQAMDLLPKDSNFYTYQGSLTTPPCSEGVKWIVMANPIEASVDQVSKLRKTLGFENNRPVHPLDGRTIRYSK